MMLRDLLPAKWRKAIYAVLGVLVGLEGIFDLLPDIWEGKLLAVFALFGFTLATANTPSS